MHVGLRFALRGGLGFGAGGIVAGIGTWLAFFLAQSNPHDPPPYVMPLILISWALAGMIGAGLMGYRQMLSENRASALLAFGLGGVLAALIILTALGAGVSSRDESWGRMALSFAGAFGLAGAIGGFALQPGYVYAGLVMFGLAGLVGGPLTLALMSSFGATASGVLLGQGVGCAITFAIAGAGFGAFVR